MENGTPKIQTASKKVINSWCMYDWANSVYTLVITTTFFPIYFIAATSAANPQAGDKIYFLGRNFVNSALYDYALGAAYFLIALTYPILTSIADARNLKKQFMQFFCYLGGIGCCMLYFFDGFNVAWGIIFFMLGAIGYSGSIVFYNAYLPEIAAEEDRDRISARGFSFGYIGSVLLQVIGFGLIIMMPDNEGLASRITFLLVGVWWIGFAQISFKNLPSSNIISTKQVKGIKAVFSDGFIEMGKVYRQVRTMPKLKRFLRGFFFYSMGVQTVMLAATIFGSKILGLDATKLIITVVIIQLVAILGAWLMSRLSEKFGNFQVLIAVIFFWILVCLAAYYTAYTKELGKDPEYMFYGLATAVGLVMGGIQSLSRSTYSKLIPYTRDTATYFSYYDFTEKIAIVIGMVSFGFIEELTRNHGGMKNSILALIVFFIIGVIWLYAALKAPRSH